MLNGNTARKMNTAVMVKIAVLSALAFLLTFLKISLPIFPSFLDLELSQLPVIVGGLAMGPIAAVLIELIKNILGVIIKPVAGGIGQLANFIFGCAYIVPLILIYRRKSNAARFIIGAIAGTLIMTVAACVLNYYFLIPVYAKIYGAPLQHFVDITAKVNGLVNSFETLIIFAVTPFNLLKAAVVSVTGYILYKALSPVMKFIESR